MPEMDGTEATEKILELMKQDKKKYIERMKSENGYEEIKCNVLALSAYSGDKNKAKALKSGMKDYMNKPLTKKDLIQYMDKYFIPLI
jgi:CheY-like chemotaxis protein